VKIEERRRWEATFFPALIGTKRFKVCLIAYHKTGL
jgi:hypothetical protein